MGSAVRHILSKEHLAEFAAWAVTQGYEHEPLKGEWEVLRMRKPGHPTVLIFSSLTCHSKIPRGELTTPEPAAALVHEWLTAIGVPRKYQHMMDGGILYRKVPPNG